jgi:hypothetical protein
MEKDKLVAACMESLVVCENAMVTLPKVKHQRHPDIIKAFNEFADICMGLLVAIKAKSVNIGKIALLYVGLAEECAELCSLSPLPSVKQGAITFRNSVNVIGQLVSL